jgi:hypothetical protein
MASLSSMGLQRVSQILLPVETCGHTSDFGIFKQITNKLSKKNFESAIKTGGIYISFVLIIIVYSKQFDKINCEPYLLVP